MRETRAHGAIRAIARIGVPVVAFALLLIFAHPAFAQAAAAPTPSGGVDRALRTIGGTGQPLSLSLQILLLMSLLTVLPSLVLMMTSFTRIIIVLSILRQALGLQQTPPNQVLVGLALFLSLFVMRPAIDQISQTAYKPYGAGQIPIEEAIARSGNVLHGFMIRQTRQTDLKLFADMARAPRFASPDAVPFSILLPAFVTSELKTAFQIGFLIFLPFLIIDLVVASTLMALGMMMLSPSIISMPFKLLLFVLVDGWALTMGSLGRELSVMKTKPIDIMLASDRRGVEPVTVAAYSAIKFSSRPVRVWMVEENIEHALQQEMIAQWARLPAFAGATFRSIRDLPYAFPFWWRRSKWPMMSCARFQVAELLPVDAERCIYLDYDTLTSTDLAELADIDLGGLPIGMVPNFGLDEKTSSYIEEVLGLSPGRYCNAGVLIADLTIWRSENIGPKLIAHGRAMPPNIWFFDQDMLNSFFNGRLYLLEERWNLRNAAARPEGNILHYAGNSKPWRTLGGDPPLAGLLAWRKMREELILAVEPQAVTHGLDDRFRLAGARLHRKLLEIARSLQGKGRE